MGSRLGKRKRLGVPNKSIDQKAERAAMEMEGTPQETPETHLAAETALDATQVMGKADCPEEPAPGTTEETESQTAKEHGEAQPSAETTKGNESQSEAKLPTAGPQITETQLDTETSEPTSEAQPVEESSLDPTDKMEAAMEHYESSPIEETTEVTETRLNVLHDQGTEAQFAGEIQPINIGVLKTEDQPTAWNREETEVPVAMPTKQEALGEAEPAAQTPQMIEAESIVETALASTEVIAARLAVQDTQLGEMQLAEIGEFQKVTDRAENCSTAEPMEVTEAQPASPSAHKILQDTKGSRPLAERSLELTKVSEVHSIAQTMEETNEGQKIAEAIEAEVCSIEETSEKTTEIMIGAHSAAVTKGESGEAQPVMPPSITEVPEAQNATENGEDQSWSETTEMTKTQPITLRTQKSKAVPGEDQPAFETSEIMTDFQPTMLGKPGTEAHETVQSTEENGEGQTALPAMRGILQEMLPTGEAQQVVEIIEESLHVTGGAHLLAETESQNTTENGEAHLIPETEAASVPNTETSEEAGVWPTAETTEAAEGKSTEDMALDAAKVSEALPAGENKAHPNTEVREAMEEQSAGTDTQSPQETETRRETVTQSTEWSVPEGGGTRLTAEAAQVQTAAPIAQKSEPATETTAGNKESCPIVQATEEMAVPPVAETEIQIAVPATRELPQDSSETVSCTCHPIGCEVQSAAQTAEVYTTALTILKFIQETSEAAAKTTEENEACPIPGTVLETPEEAETLQSLTETTELKFEKRGQDPQIATNITEDQEGGEHAAISKEEILKASESEISVDGKSKLQQYTEQEDTAASLGDSCELPPDTGAQ
ncbi:fibrous sheath CABYR-binding protein-like [Dermochelys coriacea]|uniref:fibrous sheath CABYR-binding protein-like n=1 Tax=Dermochelys coriacea TaxID=27794 RepID=UPI0018E7D141|nr:fibrous sheath CABYR-binding protein-like [Dermochelys coriacea]XP_038236911.1 fibrous sheath CABYR-binding protein-like [Dermochelys coriacea]XP_038236913.1 fibrous sheath CABYR-binding protein-like [Dermochelys coriacea]XP_038236914.1 fibrous sheath CABYR-binding protein-like [Dermochelys coriacea]XP_043356950.1 fibrous sheath CABYR-binding protein-like [Dermochelys coriacea]